MENSVLVLNMEELEKTVSPKSPTNAALDRTYKMPGAGYVMLCPFLRNTCIFYCTIIYTRLIKKA
jgi:hypothetical protein